MKTLFLALISIPFLGCAISRPLSGPGYDSHEKKLVGDPERKVIIAITNANVDRSKREPFDKKTQEIYRKIAENEGYLAGSVRLRLLGKEVWTYTIWENEESLEKFVLSRKHLDAMYTSDSAIQDMRSLRRSVRAKDIPIKWSEVESLITEVKLKKYSPY